MQSLIGVGGCLGKAEVATSALEFGSPLHPGIYLWSQGLSWGKTAAGPTIRFQICTINWGRRWCRRKKEK